MPPAKVKILLVEDDPVLGYVLKDFLQKKDFRVTHCTNGEVAWQQFMKSIYDVCLVDILLPGKKDGIELANNIRKKNVSIPIIILSSKNLENDKIAAFQSGADCYMTKPYNLQELEKRINVFLKRTRKKTDVKQVNFKIGDLDFDYANLTISNDDTDLLLTQREADLMRYLCLNPNRLIQRNELLLNIWGKDDALLRKSLEVFITRIRKYIKAQDNATLQTVHGEGFIFNYNNQSNISPNVLTRQFSI